MRHRISGVVLAGGKNSRMGGRQKALLRVGGRTVLERTLAVLEECCEDIVVVSNDRERYAGFGVPVVHDELPSTGPLSGLHAGLGRITGTHAFVVACDMPFLRIEPVRFLIGRIHDQDAVVPWWDGDIEPLHAVYRKDLRDRIVTAIAGGQLSMRAFLPGIDVEYVPEHMMRSVVGAEKSFRNVNTPEDAARYAIRV